MIDHNEIKQRCSSYPVYFKDVPGMEISGAIYIENEYHKKMNRYLKRWGWWLNKCLFDKFEYGSISLTYLPRLSKKIRRRDNILYQFPYLEKKLISGIPEIKTTDLLYYLEDPDDAQFLKPGFLFYKGKKVNGIMVYDYYPLTGLDNKALTYKEQIAELLKAYKENKDKDEPSEKTGVIGQSSGLFCSKYLEDENYADNMFESLDFQTRSKLHLFKKHVIELQQCGVPLAILERILHQNDKLSRLVITKKNEVLLPDYNNLVVKMEPLVKAVFFLFLKHPEGIIFKHLPEYRQELIDIYKDLRPLGLNKRSLQSIEDVTNPCLNSINEKCARIRAAFINNFDEHLAKNYYITGKSGEPKKISLPRDLVVWE